MFFWGPASCSTIRRKIQNVCFLLFPCAVFSSCDYQTLSGLIMGAVHAQQDVPNDCKPAFEMNDHVIPQESLVACISLYVVFWCSPFTHNLYLLV